MTLDVKPEELRAFGDMLSEAAAEAEKARDEMEKNFASVEENSEGLHAYSTCVLGYCAISYNLDSFYVSMIGALNQTKDVLKDVAKAYEDGDADNADTIAGSYWNKGLADTDPEEETGGAKGSNNVDVEENAKKFKYVEYGTPGSIIEDAKERGASWDPLETVDVPEFKEYPEAVEWAATWAMDTTSVAARFAGDWAKADAAGSSLSSIANLNNWIANSIVEAKDRLAESWEGDSSEACQKYTQRMADNISGCDNTLGDLSMAMSKYIEDVDGVASDVAYWLGGMAGFIWSADWARCLDCPKGPLQGTALPTPTANDGLSGIDKAKLSEHLKVNPYDWEGKNFASWAGKANQYVAAAYGGMLNGLLTQFNVMLYAADGLYDHDADLKGPVEAANTDLDEARKRLGAFLDY